MAVRRWLVVWVLGLVAAVAGATASAAPEAELWERWTAHDPQSQARIDHGAWNRFLVLYVVPDAEGVRRVDYGAVSDADRRALDAYVERLESVPISAKSAARLCSLRQLEIASACSCRCCVTPSIWSLTRRTS